MGGSFVVGSHQYAKVLSESGHKVVHVSTPLTPFHLLKRDEETKGKIKKANILRKVNDNLYDFIPSTISLPWKLSGKLYSIFRFNFAILSLTHNINNILCEVFGDKEIDYLIIDQPTMVGVERHINAKKVIYRPTDNYSEFMNDLNIIKAEIEILNNAHGLVATSKPVLENALKMYNKNLPNLVIENGVDFEHFSKKQGIPNEYKRLSNKKLIYVGAIDERLDLDILVRLSNDIHLNIDVIVIGPVEGSIIAKNKNNQNLHFLGAKNYKKIPAFLQHADIAILPLSNHKVNQGRSPMKLYEYGAAGLPVIVKETVELVRRKEEFMFFYNNFDEMRGAVITLLSKEFNSNIIRESVKKYSWKSKTEKLLTFIDEL
jgi:teichuronic acid biosynthesis glycosyltransferase TuaH